MKIVCCGLSKTGTTSMKKALEMLGYNTVGWSERAAQLYSKGDIKTLEKDYMLKYDAFTDRPFSMMYEYFNTKFDCKFIFTYRHDIEAWYASLKNHVVSNQRSMENFKLIYPYDILDKRALILYALSYDINILSYFNKDSKNFLLFDIFNGDGWDKLCRFLGKDIPDCEFPFVNQGMEYNKDYVSN